MTEERFRSRVSIDPSGCHIWTGSRNNEGYGRIGARRNHHLAHRLAWQLTNGPIPAGKEVCHACDNRACVNPSHLFIGTHRENMADMVRKGRSGRLPGEKHGRAKLKEADVRNIRASDLSVAKLAAIYGVGRTTVYHVIDGSTWGHLK